MFESLTDRLSGVLDKLTRRGALTESDVAAAMREVRRALLEADVALDVVKDFVERVKVKAVGQEVVKSVKPGQMVVKIVSDELTAILGSTAEPIDLHAAPPVAILMVGLQGSGKTTTTAKIAYRLKNQQRKKVLMASLDTRRPAAQEQLRVLGTQTEVESLPIIAGQTPIQIARRAQEAARLGGYDVVLLDTAGRTSIDEELMREVAEIEAATHPHEVLLVADSLTGQDAVNTAKAFQTRVGITGIVLTRADGDGRGGAALSMRAVTGKPIKLLGIGEKWDALEDFDPARVAGRILGMGDIVGLVEKAAQTIDVEKAHKIAEKMKKGAFDLDDLSEQLKQVERMGWRNRRQDGEAPARDHFVDDAEGAPQPKNPRRQAQAPHRRRLRHHARRHQPSAQDAHADGRHDEDDGQEQRHDGQDGQHDGLARWRHDGRRCTVRSRAGEDAGRAGRPGPEGAGKPAARAARHLEKHAEPGSKRPRAETPRRLQASRPWWRCAARPPWRPLPGTSGPAGKEEVKFPQAALIEAGLATETSKQRQHT
jgi:signal recognition particle protein